MFSVIGRTFEEFTTCKDLAEIRRVFKDLIDGKLKHLIRKKILTQMESEIKLVSPRGWFSEAKHDILRTEVSWMVGFDLILLLSVKGCDLKIGKYQSLLGDSTNTT